jgi:murein DD-endopeptidase MepM/ murein hydrolase activator NlpD
VTLSSSRNSSFYAAAAGKVVYSGRYSWLFNYGRLVKIQHSPEFETIYAHVKEIYVKAGESVQQGQLVASVGDSGGAHGYHLHFEIIIHGSKVNPEIYLPKLREKTPETTAASLQPN